VQPLWLGWSQPRADFSAGWTVFAPTGKWELGGADNSGLGMWANAFQAGTTVYLDPRRAWTTAMLATYEIHSRKKDTDIRVGDILTLEGGTGRSFVEAIDDSIPQIVTVGVAYYAQFKITSDQGGSPVSNPNPLPEPALFGGGRDRVFGVGGEGSVLLPAASLFLDVRVIPEFGAINRTQGITVLLSLSYQLRSLKTTKA
jgi:hypothetical protein